MKKFVKHGTLFSIFGVSYVLIELIYRGYSHWSMFVLGGICGICIGMLNECIPWEMPLWLQAGIGAVIITVLEFVCGCIVNLALGWNVWDYSNAPLNILGQVCLPFAIIWFVIAHFGIVLDDYLRYWLFKEEKPRYTYKFKH
ncbi:MAG: hypothetical protein IKB02_09150 [Clostridia bacterium]|nr:hypothetical protein [Clostridia bacterium]